MVRFADTPPTVSAFWRMFLSGILLALLVQFRHGWQPLSKKAWAWIALPSVAFAVDLWMWHRSIPVSYTHLDVYKRQPLICGKPQTDALPDFAHCACTATGSGLASTFTQAG